MNQGVAWEGMNWTPLIQDRERQRVLVNGVMNIWEFLDQL